MATNKSTFLDEQLSALTKLSSTVAQNTVQINAILSTAKAKIKANNKEIINNSFAVACLIGWCNDSLDKQIAKAWVADLLDGIGETRVKRGIDVDVID